jgi:PadR family transcriptional regulator, regulatory protein PadR
MVENNISSDLIRGHIDTIILKLLVDGDKYGYDITRIIHSKTDGEFELKEATMYSGLKRLEHEGCILSYWGDETQGGRRRYYSITEKGRKLFEKNKQNWELAKKIIEKLI